MAPEPRGIRAVLGLDPGWVDQGESCEHPFPLGWPGLALQAVGPVTRGGQTSEPGVRGREDRKRGVRSEGKALELMAEGVIST